MRAKPLASKVVLTAFAADLAIALTKFIAAILTGSSAMLSEGIHSLVDTVNKVLLLYGMKRAGKAPDASHPFGYGRELYFWSFIVSLLRPTPSCDRHHWCCLDLARRNSPAMRELIRRIHR